MEGVWIDGALSVALIGSPHGAAGAGTEERGGLRSLSPSLAAPLPWIVLFTIAAGVGQGRGRLFVAALFFTAVLAYLLAESWSGLGRLPKLDGAIRLGALSLAGAILLPNLVPGYRAGPVFPWARIGPLTETTVSPLVQIKPLLLNHPNVPLFNRAPPPAPHSTPPRLHGPPPPPARPAERRVPHERVRRGGGHPGVPAVLHLRRARPGRLQHQLPLRLPHEDQGRVLPAVRRRHGRHAQDPRHPGQGGRRVPARHAHDRHPGHHHLPGERAARPRLAGSVLPGDRLGRLRAHAPGGRPAPELHGGPGSGHRTDHRGLTEPRGVPGLLPRPEHTPAATEPCRGTQEGVAPGDHGCPARLLHPAY